MLRALRLPLEVRSGRLRLWGGHLSCCRWCREHALRSPRGVVWMRGRLVLVENGVVAGRRVRGRVPTRREVLADGCLRLARWCRQHVCARMMGRLVDSVLGGPVGGDG